MLLQSTPYVAKKAPHQWKPSRENLACTARPVTRAQAVPLTASSKAISRTHHHPLSILPCPNRARHPARMPAHTQRARARRTHHKLQRQAGMTRTLCAASPGLVGGVCSVVRNREACHSHASWKSPGNQTVQQRSASDVCPDPRVPS